MADLSPEQIQSIAEAAVRSALSQTTRLSRDDASDLVKAAATTAVNEAHIRLFAHLGYDLANIDDIKRLRATLEFTESLRERSGTVGKAVANAVAVAIALGLIGLIMLGARISVGGNVPPPAPFIK